MTHEATTLEVTWNGPYGWPGFERANNLRPIPHMPGVYLQTFEYQNGYLIYAAGITRRPVATRFRDHTRKYMNGEYNVYACGHREEFEERKSMIVDAVYKQLAEFRIFVADVGIQPRILERIESSIMRNLYRQPSPICDIPDKGMQLAPRWDSENEIIVKSNFVAVLHGLPAFLEI
jgi:hypothetical protein